MKSQLLLCMTLACSCAAKAQFDINEDLSEEVADDVDSYISSLTANPEFTSLAPQALSALPTFIAVEAQSDPADLIQDFAASPTNTAFISSIPINVIISLRRLLEKPINAVSGIQAYIERLMRDPSVTTGLLSLAQSVPQDVQRQIQEEPVAFVLELVTATTVPSWIAAVPTDVQEDLASILNDGLSIIDAAFDGSTLAPTGGATGSVTGGAPFPIITGATNRTVGTGTGTQPPSVTATGNVPNAPNAPAVPFKSGATAAEMRMLGWGAAIVLGGVAVLIAL